MHRPPKHIIHEQEHPPNSPSKSHQRPSSPLAAVDHAEHTDAHLHPSPAVSSAAANPTFSIRIDTAICTLAVASFTPFRGVAGVHQIRVGLHPQSCFHDEMMIGRSPPQSNWKGGEGPILPTGHGWVAQVSPRPSRVAHFVAIVRGRVQ